MAPETLRARLKHVFGRKGEMASFAVFLDMDRTAVIRWCNSARPIPGWLPVLIWLLEWAVATKGREWVFEGRKELDRPAGFSDMAEELRTEDA